MERSEPAGIPTEIGPPLDAQFYLQDTVAVARALLGKGLFVRLNGTELLGEIVEVEAYLGDTDPASHAFRGLNRRNGSMFENGGTSYVYLSYGINYCINVVTREKGRAEAVLLRALRPILGLPAMRANRHLAPGRPDTWIANGPGKLCQAMRIDLTFDRQQFFQESFKIIDLGLSYRNRDIAATPRIGISKARDEKLRFVIKSSPWLSRKA